MILDLICGDAIIEMKKLKNDSINLIVTDPPYNLDKNYEITHDKLSFQQYIDFSKQWLSEAKRILKPNGSIYIFMGMRFISYIHNILEQDLGFYFNNWITWHYSQGLGKIKGFSSRHDDILVFTKNKNNFTFNLDDIRIPQKSYRSINNMRGANPGNVWNFSHIHYCNKSRENHPTQKPEALYERIILASSNKNDTILDPFVGSGTCLRVCQQLHRNCIGIDINPNYIDISKKRLNENFNGFNSIDSRLLSCPSDLNDDNYRIQYLENHINWFLSNHKDSIKDFLLDVKNKYYDKMKESNQLWFFQKYQ